MTGIPAQVRESVDATLTSLRGRPDPVASATPVRGGCIHNGFRLTTESGRPFFLKWSANTPTGIFAAEANGLRALRRAAVGWGAAGTSEQPASPGPIRVPEPLAWDDGPAGWLLMEYFEPAPAEPTSAETLGRGLAHIHATGSAGSLGWPEPNWIGSLDQDNASCAEWSTFWRVRRIAPQLARAREHGTLNEPVFDRLMESIPSALEGVGPPALLHGDLWSGNTFTTKRGAPVLIDPAVFVGDGEVDLAMTELFGGFAPAFYAAYDELRPISAAYRSHRRDLYQLYYLLVHVNLFGGTYVASARRAAEVVVAALG
jgi:fructosamine-3-kinase